MVDELVERATFPYDRAGLMSSKHPKRGGSPSAVGLQRTLVVSGYTPGGDLAVAVQRR